MGALGGDADIRRRLLRLALGADAHEIGEVALVERDLRAIEMRDGIDAAFQQAAVMADHDGGPREARQPAFEPHGGFEVEMVGRFVEQQQFRFEEQRAGEGDTHAPAAGEFARGPRLGRRVEAEAGEDGAGPRRGTLGADADEAVVDFSQSRRVGVAVGLGKQRGAFGIGGEDDVEQGLVAARGFLGDMGHAGAGGEADLATVGLQFMGDGAQQGGFAGTVPPDQPDLAAVIDLQVRPVQQVPAGDADGQVADG